MHTSSYEFLVKPKESARCHQTLSVGGGGGGGGVWGRDYTLTGYVRLTKEGAPIVGNLATTSE